MESGKPPRELAIATATGKYEEEGWRVRKDGSLFWASVVITALRNDGGVLHGFAKVTRDMTERKRAEESARRVLQEETARLAAEASALEAKRVQQEERRHREQLHVTLRSIGDGVIVTDSNGAVTFMNPVAVALTGWQPHEAAGQALDRVFVIVNEETRQPVESPVPKVLRDGTVVGLANHTLLIARDGREIPIDDSGAPIRGEDETIAGVVLVFRDVTEARKAVEARLHLAAIVESSDDAIISKDLAGRIISWNKGAERLYGYTAQEIVGQPLSILVPPDHPDELPGIMERIKRGERIQHFETVRLHKDGRRVDVSLTISPVKNAEGKIIGASKIARDITVRKRHEATLRFLAEASKLLAELLDTSSTLQKLAGLAVPQFADGCAVDLLEADGSLRQVAAAPVERKVGQTFLSASRLTPQVLSVPLTARGRVIGALTFGTAKSGRLFGPDDLRLAEDLAQRASIAIENARLYAELKEADRQKNEWIAMLAHELRNPLAPIRNALYIMKMPGANAESIEQARQVTERQVQHLVRLVDDLLDVSRIIRGRIELRKEPIDLASVVARGAETTQPLIDAQGQQLIVSVPPEPLRLEGDPTRLAQVVSNLVHNAGKFSGRSARIWLTAERQGAEAVLRVRDEGAGIAGHLLPHIFDLFTQGNRSLERSEGGLGIGLTVVRKLVEMHGGTVTAHSEGPGKGSEFVVRLPGILEALRPRPARPVRTRLRQRLPAGSWWSMTMWTPPRVWPCSCAVLGHEVRLTHTGPEALQTADQFQPEVVVLDIGLPGMNGYEVARRLRQDPRFRKTLLIAVTGYGQQEDRLRSLEAGFDQHLVKPVDPDAFQQVLANLK